MTITKKALHSQFIIFVLCMIVFTVAAGFGWNKLHYGFNFIDEGYHMTESWRLATGDDFLKDKITGALMHYTLINSLIFKICPDITLLDFRKIQYMLTMFSLLIFSLALFKVSRQYAWLPFIFSLFAFTGLDPVGMISNLSYQTYPHLFLTLSLSFLLLGLHVKNSTLKKFFYLLSGFCLWLISLSLLYLSVIIISPILTFFLLNKFNLKSYHFSLRDLSFVIAPFVFCWMAFIIIYNKAYLLNLSSSLDVYLSMDAYSKGLINVNWDAIKYISISFLFLIIFFAFIKQNLHPVLLIASCIILSVLLFYTINTSCFGLLNPYYKVCFSKPLWFSSLLTAFTILFWIYTASKHYIAGWFKKEEGLSILLMIPFTICSLTMATFSSNGALAVSQCAIPAVAAISYLFYANNKYKYNHAITTIALILLLTPFYYTTEWFDWHFTFFDVSPKYANAKIERGFGKGIYTNKIYYNLYEWLSYNAEKYTEKDDYILSYVVSPMVHMITKRRPSLDDTYIMREKPLKYYAKCIEVMKQKNRNPKMAFIFERRPYFFSESIKLNSYTWTTKTLDFSLSQDPISNYVKSNMKQISEFKISNDNIIRCFIDNKAYSSP